MVFSRPLFSFQRRKTPGKSPAQKGNTSTTTPKSQKKHGKRHLLSIPNFLRFLKRKPNKVACSQHTDTHLNSKVSAPHEGSGHHSQYLNQKAIQDHDDSIQAIINVNPTATSSVTKTEDSRKESQASSPCQVRFNLPPSAQATGDSPQRRSTPQTVRPPLPELCRENSRKVSPNNCRTIPLNSHPLSQRQCAESLYCSKQKPEAKPESCEINENYVDVIGEAEDCDDESDELSSTASSKCCSEDLPLLSSVNYKPPLSLGAIDRIKRHCSVDIDTDFIANFNYDFLNDNII